MVAYGLFTVYGMSKTASHYCTHTHTQFFSSEFTVRISVLFLNLRGSEVFDLNALIIIMASSLKISTQKQGTFEIAYGFRW